MTGQLQKEITQAKPFASLQQETYLNILRTADVLSYQAEDLLRKYELTSASYNILRILRGAGSAGLTCGEIGSRMLTRVPDVTRLLDRLEVRAVVKRERQETDRRVIKACITRTGLSILSKLDKPTTDLHRSQFTHLSAQQMKSLIQLLEIARAPKAPDGHKTSRVRKGETQPA